MGQSSSRFQSESLHNKIIEEVKELIYKYDFWTKEDICDKLALVYYDKLIQFKSSDILDASASVGIVYDKKVDDKEIDKHELCAKIIDHYRKRIELLNDIKTAVEEGYLKLLRAQKGPICKNADKYVGDFLECQKIKGVWLNEDQYGKIVENLKKNGNYDEWKTHIVNLDSSWKKNLQKLSDVIEIIKRDIDNSIDESKFAELKKHTNETIEKIEKMSNIYYLLATNFA